MIAFTSMLVPAAKQAGMKIPPNVEEYDREKYPHFNVFETVQIGAAVPYHGAHWDNAKVIADIPDNRIESVTLDDLIGEGLAFSTGPR